MGQREDGGAHKNDLQQPRFQLPSTSIFFGSVGTGMMLYPHVEDYFIADINDTPQLYEDAAKEFCINELSAKTGLEKSGDSLSVSFSEKAYTTCVDNRLDMQRAFKEHTDNFFAGAADIGGIMVAASLLWAAYKYRGHKLNQNKDNQSAPKPS